ncbi:hypothetical protein EYC84_001829 [Monilinia fructicola]|uniref:GST N-terminal domain-containing protein n=1 Tax=Monilinia fructicola TaxID=38448 RepID=A0A5M9JYT5_MONFR|nr:hypothetical protein EYC84_001829 [Monilinia fructicola]
MSEPITLYSHATGPNPWKVAIILEELKIPYTTKFMGSFQFPSCFPRPHSENPIISQYMSSYQCSKLCQSFIVVQEFKLGPELQQNSMHQIDSVYGMNQRTENLP